MPVAVINETMYVVLKSAGDPLSLTGSARRVVREADPLLAIIGMRSMDEMVAGSVRLALVGLAIGMVGAVVATRLMTTLLYGVSTTDPVTYAAIALLLAVVAFFASWLPARRAVATEPTTALRTE